MKKQALALVLALFLLAVPLLAHETKVQQEAWPQGYGAGLSSTPEQPEVGRPTQFSVVLVKAPNLRDTPLELITRATGLSMQAQVQTADGSAQLFFAQAAESAGEPGEYRFSYTFQKPGEYQVVLIFRDPAGEVIKPAFKVTASDPRVGQALGGGILAGLVIIALAAWRALPHRVGRKKRPFSLKVLAIGIVLGLAAAGIGYSLASYYAIGGEAGFTVCGTDGCLLALHVHAQVDSYVCGEYLKLPLETGRLDGPHTHKERNRIHLHRNLRVAPGTNEVTAEDKKAYLSLGAFFDAMGVPFMSTRLGDKSNGNLCPNGRPSELKMWVNGKSSTEFREYVWKDGDRIVLAFGDVPAGVSISEPATAGGCAPGGLTGCGD